MADNPVKTKPNVEIQCQILRFEENPKGGQNVFVECTLGKHVWVKQLWSHYDRPISMEQFIIEFKDHVWQSEKEIELEKDNLRFVKEVADQPFTISVPPKN